MSSSDWLREFLDHVQLPDFYGAFKDVLHVTQLQHFDFVRSADLYRIGLSAPAIGRIKDALKVYRENAGLPRHPRKKHHYGLSFGIPILDFLRYGPPRDAPILSTSTESAPPRRCHFDVATPTAPANSPSSSLTDPLLTCQLIRQEDIILHEEKDARLGSGSFGVVRRGDWTTPTGKKLPVALKILRRSKTNDPADFFSTVLSEVMLMQSVLHPNLVRIYGVIPLNPLVIVTELAPMGSLLTALRVHSHRLATNSLTNPATAFSVDVLWDMGVQLARGMAHLASCYLIHRDLAARNVLLFNSTTNGSAVTVKIGDFGLLRRGTSTESDDSNSTQSNLVGFVYVGQGKQKIPFAWSPPEAIQSRHFSQASDVWSWGVTVWEIWSGGAEPWSGLNSDAVLSELKAARRLPWLRFTCPRRLYQLLLATWRFEPDRRPSFEYLVERLDKIRPAEVVATRNFDEADRMDVVAGDRILVIEGRADNFWWRGQNRRTGEIASFPREIVRLQRNLQSQDISRPIQSSFVHVGHHGVEGRAWGHVDHIDPAFLSGVTLHHADTLSHAYACQPVSTSQSSWRPLSNASLGGASASGVLLTGFKEDTTNGEGELGDTPRVDTYDEVGDGEVDERRLLDEASKGTIGAQRLAPPPRDSEITSKLAKDLEASIASEYCSMNCNESLPVPLTQARFTTNASRSHNSALATITTRGTGSWAGRSVRGGSSASTNNTTSSVPLIDFHQSTPPECDTRFPAPSAPIYQSAAAAPVRNPYFQAAWNAWMRQPTLASRTPPQLTEEVERIQRLFDATIVNPPLHQQHCERELLVGASTSTRLNPFLSLQTSPFPEPI